MKRLQRDRPRLRAGKAGASAPLLQLEDVSFRYGARLFGGHESPYVLRGIDLQLDDGETLGVVGESGSGKSTLAKLSLGLHLPTAGSVRFDGKVYRRRSRRSLRGMRQVVLQNPLWSLDPRLRCRTSIGEPLAIERVGTRAARRLAVDALLEQVGLPREIGDRYPHELSGGQQQRVAIARALATNPRLLVLDEIVSALDVSVQAQILNLVKRLQQERGFGAIFISHDLAVVRYVAHRVAVLYAGTLVELAPATALYEGSAHPYSRTLQLAHSATPDERFELREAGGTMPEPGCVLAPRCPFAIERCSVETPRLRQVGESLVACHRAEEVASISPADGYATAG